MESTKKTSIPYKNFTTIMEDEYYKPSFYESGLCLFYLLNSAGYTNSLSLESHARVFSKNIHRSFKLKKILDHEMIIDETVAESSNALHSNLYDYLWGTEGNKVYIHPKDNNQEITVAMENDFILKRAITSDREFNTSIRIALKNCIDYGVGYVFTDSNFYKPLHPLSMQKCVHGKETCYVYEQATDRSSLHNESINYNYRESIDKYQGIRRNIYIFGKHGYFSKTLGIEVPENEFFLLKCETINDKDMFISKLKTNKHSFIHELSLPFYEDELGMSIGCGMKALGAAIALADITMHAFRSQQLELSPPSLITSVVPIKSRYGLEAGTFYNIDQEKVNEVPPVIYPTPARAGNSIAYMDTWRNKIKECYILGAISNQGRGQTTAAEASTNYSNIDAMMKSMIRPFDWFIMPLIKRFVHNSKKELRKESDFDYTNTRLVLLGGTRSADIFSKVSVMLQEIQAVASITGSMNPTSVAMFKSENIIYGMLSDELPKWFLLTPEEYHEGILAMQEQLQQQQEQQ